MGATDFSRANALFRDGDYQGAIKLYRKAIKDRPDLYLYHENLAKALQVAGFADEAARARTDAQQIREQTFPHEILKRNALGSRRETRSWEKFPREPGWAENPDVKPMLEASPQNEAELKEAYAASSLSEEPDTFVLYRIIGNDLYPRHEKGQSRQNVRFILENEPELEGCEKRWVVNRIFDAEERQAIIELLEEHGQSYLEIPFEAEAFQQIGWDYSTYPESGYLSSAAFYQLGPMQQERVITATYRKKNVYLMNNNGARNAALEDGRDRAKWVLPWDGNCFVTREGWQEIRSAVCAEPHLPYFAVPMQRMTDNAQLLSDDFTPNPVEEPQLLVRRDARERFGENHPYGRRPKVELFWRLGILGKWTRWKDDTWDQPRSEPSRDSGAWGVAGWVARLASGKAHLEASTTESFKNRGRERQKAIRVAINHVTKEVSAQPDPIGLTSYRLEAIEALRAEYQEQGESGPQADLLETLRANAAEALERKPESPVDKPEPGPSGDLQDYYHPAPYWWPNPDTADGLPYVKRDGERVPGTRMYEPESHRYDRTRLQRLFDDSTTLALAAFVTGDERYATHAVRWLERWFIDPATRMNPHFIYAQVRWGHKKNRGAQSGVIEMKDLYYYLDAVRLLKQMDALNSEKLEGVHTWLSEYLNWLLTSEQGIKEAQARNNHGTYYDLQVAAIAGFLDDQDTLFATLARAEERIPLQITPDGVQHEEMTRTNTAHYCCFTLQGWLNLLNLAIRFDGTLIERAAKPSHPLRKALEWLLAHKGSPWPYQQISDFDHQRFLPLEALGRAIGLTPEESTIKGAKAPACFSPHDGVQVYWPLSLVRHGQAHYPTRSARDKPSDTSSQATPHTDFSAQRDTESVNQHAKSLTPLVGRAEAILLTSPNGEAEKGSHRWAIKQLQRELEQSDGVGDESEQAVRDLYIGKLAGARGDWEKVKTVLERLSFTSEEAEGERLLGLALAKAKRGCIAEATALHERARQMNGSDVKFGRFGLRAVQRDLAQAEAGLVSAEVREYVEQGGGGAELRETLERLCRIRKEPKENAKIYEDIILGLQAFALPDPSELHRRVLEIDDPAATEEAAQRELLFVAGFGWSGSGAAYDLLQAADGGFTPLAKSETWLWKGQDGFDGLIANTDEGGQAVREAVRRLVLGPVLGLPPSPSADGGSYWTRSLACLRGDTATGRATLRRAVLKLLLDIRQLTTPTLLSKDSLMSACGQFFYRLVSEKKMQGKPLIFNNVIKAEQLRWLPYIPGGKALVIARDPRDATVSRFYEKNIEWSSERAKEDAKKRARIVSQTLSRADGHKIRCIWFEDLVTDKRIRSSVLRWCGVACDEDENDKSVFDPNVSAKNIGIWRSYLNKGVIRAIEEGVSEIDPAILRNGSGCKNEKYEH